MDKYLILSDEDESILNIHFTALKYFYGGEVVTASSIEKIIEVLKLKGRPELIIIDFNMLSEDEGKLHSFLENQNLHAPIVASCINCEDLELLKKFPISALLEKPVSAETIGDIVKSITNAPIHTPSHVPVKIETVLDLSGGGFEYYLKLSGSNFIKIINKGDDFTNEDAQKLKAKGITEVHIRASESHDFLKAWEKKIRAAVDLNLNERPEHFAAMAISSFEQIEGISKALGWSREVLDTAHKAVTSALKLVHKDVKLSKLLKERLSPPSSSYAVHVGLMTYLTCGFYAFLHGPDEGAQLKLAMASLLHDLAVDDAYYEDIKSWNKKGANLKDRSPDILKYRLHPLQAAKLAQSFDLLPPDVDHIILQHHEMKDGTGFPRGLMASRIGYLSSLFILVEDLVEFIQDRQHIETGLKDFITWGQSYYDSGHFEKLFISLKNKIC